MPKNEFKGSMSKQKKVSLEDTWKTWRETKDPAQFNTLLKKLEPTMKSAIHTYAGGRAAPSVRSKAKILAARALDRYDPKKGSKLKGFVYQQLQPLTRYSARAGQPMPIPEKAELELRRIKEAQKELTSRYGREPTHSEMADYLKLSTKRIQKVLGHYSHPTVSETQISQPEGMSEQTDFSPGVQMPDYDEIWSDYVYMSLDPVDKKIMEWRTGRNGVKPLANKAIARKLKMSPGAVSQRAAKITAKLLEGNR